MTRTRRWPALTALACVIFAGAWAIAAFAAALRPLTAAGVAGPVSAACVLVVALALRDPHPDPDEVGRRLIAAFRRIVLVFAGASDRLARRLLDEGRVVPILDDLHRLPPDRRAEGSGNWPRCPGRSCWSAGPTSTTRRSGPSAVSRARSS